MQFRSNAKPSVYAYPEPLQPPKKEEKEKVSTAILSITAKSKARQKKETKDEAMEIVSWNFNLLVKSLLGDNIFLNLQRNWIGIFSPAAPLLA